VTNSVELYDIAANAWLPVDSMTKPRVSTSMCAVAGRLVFIFHGLPSSQQPTASNCMEFIDLVSFDQPAYKTAKWESITVVNNDFISGEPKGSANIQDNSIIVFGGTSSDTYSFEY